MARQRVERSIDPIDQFIGKCREFMDGWVQFSQIMAAYVQPGANHAQLENHFLKIKSHLARQHQVLRTKLAADFTFDPNVMNILAGTPNLEALYSQSEVAVKKVQNEWHRAFISMNETLGNLEEKRRRAAAGERIVVGGILFHIPQHKPLPWKKIAAGAAVIASLLLIAGGYYFMRNFLGFWAPESGEGMVIAETMSDDERIQVTLDTVLQSVEKEDVDRMMTAYSDNYRDDDGNSKTQLRVMLQGIKTSGAMATARLDGAGATVHIEGELATVGPIKVITPDDEGEIRLVMVKEGDRWLINKISGL